MTESFMKYVIDNFDIWYERRKEYIKKENETTKLLIEKQNRIKELLQDEKVRLFAEEINYKEEKINRQYLKIEDPLLEFLKTSAKDILWTDKELQKDEYPIYCFINSNDPIYSVRTHKRMNSYRDIYWNLQRPGKNIGPEDYSERGKNREYFKIKYQDNIIYPPKGKSFKDNDTFYLVQSEYVKEALNTNQEHAKKLILTKYGKNSSNML